MVGGGGVGCSRIVNGREGGWKGVGGLASGARCGCEEGFCCIHILGQVIDGWELGLRLLQLLAFARADMDMLGRVIGRIAGCSMCLLSLVCQPSALFPTFSAKGGNSGCERSRLIGG